jgi:hypothetical protein
MGRSYTLVFDYGSIDAKGKAAEDARAIALEKAHAVNTLAITPPPGMPNCHAKFA